uniref:Uncharacterized protein n=1 Tax=Glossina morsitans morsitans TaxID=37546 RepID=A0ABK9NG85_GLOMM
MFGPYPYDYSEIADKFRKTGCYKYLTSPVLAASRCGPCFSQQENYYELPQSSIPQLRSHRCQSNRHTCKCKNVCDEIRYNLWLASTKSSIYIPDTATKWFECQQQLSALYKRYSEFSSQRSLAYRMPYCQLQPYALPPAMNLKPPLRLMGYSNGEGNAKYMSPEFADLLNRHNEIMHRLHHISNLPPEYRPRILKNRRQRLASGNEQSAEKLVSPRISLSNPFYPNVDERRNCENPLSSESVTCDQDSCYSNAHTEAKFCQELPEEKKTSRKRKRKSFSSAPHSEKSKILREIWKKPNATEMRESVASFRLDEQVSKHIPLFKSKNKMETQSSLLPSILEEPENKKVIQKPPPPPVPPKPRKKYILGKQGKEFAGVASKIVPNLTANISEEEEHCINISPPLHLSKLDKELLKSSLCLSYNSIRSTKSDTVQKNPKMVQSLPKSNSAPSSTKSPAKTYGSGGHKNASIKYRQHIHSPLLTKTKSELINVFPGTAE